MDTDSKITDFCAVTGASTEVAENYLQIADGDVETAVTLYLESGDGASQPVPTATETDTRQSTPSWQMEDSSMLTDEELARQFQQEEEERQQRVRAPIAPKHDILAGGSPMFDEQPFWRSSDATTYPPRSVFNQGDSSTSPRDPLAGRSTSFAPVNPTGSPAVSAKTRRLADLFRPPFDIMFEGGFEEARAAAREKNKWLLINIHNPTEFACQVLNRDLWSDPFVKDLVKESFIFLQYHNDTPEGKRYLTLYPIQTYPHTAIIDARTGERVKVWESTLTPNDFLMEVTEFLEQSAPPEVARSAAMKRPRTMKNISDMSEEEQINAAIAASLGSTPQTMSSTSHEGSQISLDDEAKVEEAENEAKPEEQEEEQNQVTSVLDSIQPVQRDEPTDLANSTRIQIRMADGSRLIRRLLKSDPVRYLFEFIKYQVPEAQSRPFELVFNRQQLIELVDQSIEEAGLANAAVNFVFA
ncbi:uncharacterized protein BYT42DRAFT_541665 [Radiomyces spectabilis]|uniref:uncharacterized protein n=1 Tax=Radiomyces spectabilis TaxID=64574 RepID=UPI00221EBFD0|nr:uncharacterized protein BYT42DRAFT_541665 [Radiomyces spectabilis]KAI8393388.1 hypothetical protein BYT42DRAFT_541665 [Radiomyces spectabilis]